MRLTGKPSRLLSAAIISTLLASGAFAQQRAFDLPEQDAVKSIPEFARQAGIQISAPTEELKGIRTPRIQGELDVRAALKRLIEGTGLEVASDESGMVVLQPRRAGNAVLMKVPGAKTTRSHTEARDLRLAQADTSTTATTTQSGAAIGEPERQGLEEIIVTAQKRSERLQEVPVPVTVLKTDKLTAFNQLRVEDYYTKLPGLSLTLSGNGSDAAIAVRGLKTSAVSNPTVGILIDEVSYGASVQSGFVPSVPNIDPGDLAHIELLRGPQGTLYGASSIGGLLKFVTIDPSTEDFGGSVTVGGASIEDGATGYNARGNVNVPLGDTVAVRASAFTTRDPGYVDNVRTGKRDVNDVESDGGRLAVLWRPSDRFSVKLSALSQEIDRRGSPEVDNTLGSEVLAQQFLPGVGVNQRKSEIYSATMTGLLGQFELTSVTGYSTDEGVAVADGGPTFIPQAIANFGVAGVNIPTYVDAEKFTQELRVSVPIGDRLNWLFGAFYMDEKTEARPIVTAANPATGAGVGALLRTELSSPFEEYAVFTNLTVDVTDRLDVQFGGRWSKNRLSFQNMRSGPLAASLFGANPFVSPLIKAEESPVTYLVTPRFKFSPNLMGYARFASGYRPGGPNAACGLTGIPCQFDSDTTQNYELGLKGDVLDRLLTFDASIYYIDWKDVQVRVTSPLFTSTGYTVNEGRARSQGVELSAELQPTESLTVAAWVAYNEAELAETLPNRSTSIGRAGDVLPYSNRWSGNLSVDQEFPLWSGVTGAVGGSLSYVGERKGEFPASAAQGREIFPSYTQLDLRAVVTYDNWKVNAFVNNATDKRGLLKGGENSLLPVHIYIQPRTVGFSLSRTF